jgi:MFS family permease
MEKTSRRRRAGRGPDALLLQNYKRNVAGLVLYESLWGLGVPFVLFGTVVPAYLTVLGSSKALIGFVMSLWSVLIPLQLLGGHYFNGPRRLRTMVALYIGGVGVRLTYDILALFVPGLWTPAALVTGLVLALVGYVCLLIIGQAIYAGVLTDNIPRKRRGWVFGMRTLGLGLGGILTGAAAAWVLHRWPSPVNYRVSFLIGDSIWVASCFALLLVRDVAAPARRRVEKGFLGSLRDKLRHLVSNPNYRIFIFSHLLNALAAALASFLVPFAKERLAVPDGTLAALGVIFLASGAALGLAIGRIADRFGYRLVGVIQSTLLLAFFVIAIAARSFAAVCVAYGVFSLVSQTLSFVLVNMSVELCPDLAPADLAALGGSMVVPFVAVMSPLAGTIIDLTGSYQSVFFIGATVAMIALLGFGLLVREPRTGRLYQFRQGPLQ